MRRCYDFMLQCGMVQLQVPKLPFAGIKQPIHNTLATHLQQLLEMSHVLNTDATDDDFAI